MTQIIEIDFKKNQIIDVRETKSMTKKIDFGSKLLQDALEELKQMEKICKSKKELYFKMGWVESEEEFRQMMIDEFNAEQESKKEEEIKSMEEYLENYNIYHNIPTIIE